MSNSNIKYCAGFFDGEGTVSIIHQRCPRVDDKEHRIHVLYVGISNTFKEPLEFIKETTGIGNIRVKPIKDLNSNWKHIYLWEIKGPKAGKFLSMVYPYLIVKKEFAKEAVIFQKKISKQNHKPFVDRRWQSDYCQKIRNLNYTKGAAKNFRPCWFISTKPIVWNKGIKHTNLST